jgi:outer membrane protein assembly factor BamB
LFFIGPDARLWRQQRLPAAAIEASAGNNQWFVACRNGRVYAFSLDGSPLWSELIPCARRDNATNEYWGLPVFHPRLYLAADGGLLAVGAEQEFHRYDDTSGKRLWSDVLPEMETSGPCTIAIDLPTREQRLLRLGLKYAAGRDEVRTGYLRLKLDTLLNAGWLKQAEVSDFETADEGETPSRNIGVEIGIGLAFKPGVRVLRASGNAIMTGTQDGFVHVFDREGALQQSFQVGETAVSDLLVSRGALNAAYCAGRLTLFESGRVSATAELPEYYTELTDCGSGVLAWKWNSVWLVDPSGRVQLAAQSDRPIRGVWGFGTGFYVLAGELASFASPAARDLQR